MNLKTLLKKNIEGGKFIMTEPTMLFSTANTPVIGKFTVTEDYIGRIDLIARQIYGNESYADYILKYNGISNPFTIGEGDVLFLPAHNATFVNWTKPVNKLGDGNPASDAVRDKFLQTKRLPIEDQKRVEYLKRKAAKYPNAATELLPPNVLKTGQSNLTILNGTITLKGGGDLTK
jgi:hypothetical protein